MTTIGKKWLAKQRLAKVGRIVEADKRYEVEQAKIANEIISGIPDLVASVGDGETACVYTLIRDAQVAGQDEDRVFDLASRLDSEKRSLRPDDLVGAARLICIYCDHNDLDCVLVLVRADLSSVSYDMHIRPRLG